MANDHDKAQEVHILSVRNIFGAEKTNTQISELTVPDQDVERTSVSGSIGVLLADPFQLSDGIVPDEQIAGLRRRKKGKRVAKYQLRQNDVCDRATRILSQLTTHTASANLGIVEAHGRAHGRREN